MRRWVWVWVLIGFAHATWFMGCASCEQDPASGSSPDDDAQPVTTDSSTEAARDNDATALRQHVPGDAFVISTANASGQDEDPALLKARDGTLHVAWYSNRLGLQPANGDEDKEIFVARAQVGESSFSAPAQATKNVARAFYPTLAEDKSGTVHLAWWRVIVGPPGCTFNVSCVTTDNRIVYKTSPDGVAWDLSESAAAETEITTGPGDWLPSAVYDASSSRLLVYFAAVARDEAGIPNLGETTSRIFVVIKTAAGGWSQVMPLVGVTNSTSHNTYPHVVQRSNGSFLMTWTRYEINASNEPIQIIGISSTNTMVATSDDGVTWTGAKTLSDGLGDGGALDLFPIVYADHASTSWRSSWITTAFGGAKQIELPVEGAAIYPTDVIQRPEPQGYTTKFVATSTPDIYFGVSVNGANPTKQKIEGRFFKR